MSWQNLRNFRFPAAEIDEGFRLEKSSFAMAECGSSTTMLRSNSVNRGEIEKPARPYASHNVASSGCFLQVGNLQTSQLRISRPRRAAELSTKG